MLSNSLSNSISDEQLEGYFKNFEKIKLKSLSPLVYTLYTYNEATDYIITLDNDKISEIDNL